MADIFDVAMSTVCDASVMCQTLSEYGDGSMGNGILKYGNEMLVIGEKVGYEQGVKDTFQVAFKEGFDEGYSQGFSQGNSEGIIKYYQTLYNKLIFNFSCRIEEVPA